MRAHGIGDESGNLDEEDPTSDWEERGNSSPNKRMYKLRTNPNRLKSCKVCANCGKEFSSWKSFLEHGKCSSESPESSPESDGGDQGGCQWSKRKRSLRGKMGSSNSLCTYSEEEDYAATCLVMLSNARVDPRTADQPEESCASASKEEERRKPMSAFFAPVTLRPVVEKGKGVAKGMFECKACKKVFNSHQALGGHRASHKKVQSPFTLFYFFVKKIKLSFTRKYVPLHHNIIRKGSYRLWRNQSWVPRSHLEVLNGLDRHEHCTGMVWAHTTQTLR